MSKTYLIFPKVLKGEAAYFYNLFNNEAKLIYTFPRKYSTGDRVDGIIQNYRNYKGYKVFIPHLFKKPLEQIREVGVEV